jgi:hypothetical protein
MKVAVQSLFHIYFIIKIFEKYYSHIYLVKVCFVPCCFHRLPISLVSQKVFITIFEAVYAANWLSRYFKYIYMGHVYIYRTLYFIVYSTHQNM